MSSKKRTQECDDTQKRKKAKLSKEVGAENAAPVTSVLSKDEVDFPRGGGTTFSAIEYKQIRTEALKEMKDDVFKVGLLCFQVGDVSLTSILLRRLGRRRESPRIRRRDPENPMQENRHQKLQTKVRTGPERA